MGLKYHFEYNPPFMFIKVEPNSKTTGYLPNLEGWLECDVGREGEENLKAIKEYLKHPTEEYLFLGLNAYEVYVKKDYTTIVYIFEDENPQMVPCTLPTKMVCKILKVWIKAEKEHRKKYG